MRERELTVGDLHRRVCFAPQLADRLDVVINSAASVNFREELDKALEINALCLRNIVDLSKTGGQIPVIQVSTCYVNGMNAGQAHEDVVRPAKGNIARGDDGLYEVEELIHLLPSSTCSR